MGVHVCKGVATQKCTFCKNWYDPMNSVINPYAKGMWEYEPKVKKKCLYIGVERKAMDSCLHFESKI